MDIIMNFGGILGAIVLFLVATSKNKTVLDDLDNSDNGTDDAIFVNDIVGQLARDYSQSYAERDLNQITQFVIHHSATTSGSAAAYANYHVDTNGWPGIGYHYVIDKDGTINLTNYWETIAYNVSDENHRTIGICLTGNFDIQQPTPQQLESVIKLVRNLSYTFGQLPVYPHNRFSSKTCPGLNVSTNEIQDLAYNNIV